MKRKARKLLDRMRASKHGWRPRDLHALFEGHDFVIEQGGNHETVTHPKMPEFITQIPRHSEVAPAYVRVAIQAIEQLLSLFGDNDAVSEEGDITDGDDTSESEATGE